MRLEKIIIKPILSEKANHFSEKLNCYTFKVEKQSNKIEIKNAVSKMYNVTVLDVKTSILPSKTKTRMTKRGMFVGGVSAYKKAFVWLSKGDKIDFYSEI